MTNKLASVKRFISQLTWIASGSGVNKLIVLLLSTYLIRSTGPENYGQYVQISATILAIGVIANFGMNITAVRSCAIARARGAGHEYEIFYACIRLVLLISAPISIVVAVSADNISSLITNDGRLADAIRISSISILSNSVCNTSVSGLIGVQRYRAATVIPICTNVTFLALLIIQQFYGELNINKIATLYTFSNAFGAIISLLLWYYPRPIYSVKIKSDHFIWSELARQSIPTVLSSAALAAVSWFVVVFISRHGGGAQEVAMYNISIQWLSAVMFLPAAAGQMVLPQLSKITGRGKNDEIRLIFAHSVSNTLPAIFIAAILIAFSEHILKLYGNNIENESAFTLIILSGPLMALNAVVAAVIASKGRLLSGFIFNTIWAISVLSALIYFSNYFSGAVSYGLAALIAYSIHSVLQISYLWRMFRDKGM